MKSIKFFRQLISFALSLTLWVAPSFQGAWANGNYISSYHLKKEDQTRNKNFYASEAAGNFTLSDFIVSKPSRESIGKCANSLFATPTTGNKGLNQIIESLSENICGLDGVTYEVNREAYCGCVVENTRKGIGYYREIEERARNDKAYMRRVRESLAQDKMEKFKDSFLEATKKNISALLNENFRNSPKLKGQLCKPGGMTEFIQGVVDKKDQNGETPCSAETVKKLMNQKNNKLFNHTKKVSNDKTGDLRKALSLHYKKDKNRPLSLYEKFAFEVDLENFQFLSKKIDLKGSGLNLLKDPMFLNYSYEQQLSKVYQVFDSQDRQRVGEDISSLLISKNKKIEDPLDIEKVQAFIAKDQLRFDFIKKAAGQAANMSTSLVDIEDIIKSMAQEFHDKVQKIIKDEALDQKYAHIEDSSEKSNMIIKDAIRSMDEEAILDSINLCQQAQESFMNVCRAMTNVENDDSLVDLLDDEAEKPAELANELIKEFGGNQIDKDNLKEQLSVMICIDQEKRQDDHKLGNQVVSNENKDFLEKAFKGKYSYEPVTDTDKDFQKVFGYSRASRGKASSSNAKVSASGGAVSSFSNGNGGAKTAKSASSQDSGAFANSNQQEALPQDYSVSQYEANFYEANLRDNEQPAEVEGSDNSSQKENAKIASLENKIEELMNKIESSKLEKKENQELDFENQTDFTEDDYELTKLKKELKKAQEELESEKEALAQRKAKRPERRGFASTYTDGITNIRNFGNGSQGNSGHNNSNRPLNDVINNAFNGGAIPSSSASFSESKGKYQNNREGITLDSSSFSNESEISEGIITIEGEKARVFEANHDLKEAFELAAGEPALIEVEDGQFMRIICNELSGECDLEHVDVDKKGGEGIASGGEVDQERVVSGDSFVGPQKPSLKWGEAKAIVEQATQESE